MFRLRARDASGCVKRGRCAGPLVVRAGRLDSADVLWWGDGLRGGERGIEGGAEDGTNRERGRLEIEPADLGDRVQILGEPDVAVGPGGDPAGAGVGSRDG